MTRTHRVLISLVLIVPACSKNPDVKQLEQAANAVQQMVVPFYATRSSFFVVLPNGTPKQFVSWFFSPMGVAEWPPIDKADEFSQEELDAMRRGGLPLRPDQVTYRHSKPDPSVQKQVVLRWDDAEGVVILDGYLDPAQEPIFTKSFKLPKGIIPDEMARVTTQSNVELGMSYQAFE